MASVAPTTRIILERMRPSSVWELPQVRVGREAGFGANSPRTPYAGFGPGCLDRDAAGSLQRRKHGGRRPGAQALEKALEGRQVEAADHLRESVSVVLRVPGSPRAIAPARDSAAETPIAGAIRR